MIFDIIEKETGATIAWGKVERENEYGFVINKGDGVDHYYSHNHYYYDVIGVRHG